MIRFFIFRLLLPLLLFLLLRAVLKSFLAGVQSGAAKDTTPKVTPGGELRKDPVCGTYVPMATSLSREAGGKVLYFCSKECRDRYV